MDGPVLRVLRHNRKRGHLDAGDENRLGKVSRSVRTAQYGERVNTIGDAVLGVVETRLVICLNGACIFLHAIVDHRIILKYIISIVLNNHLGSTVKAASHKPKE